MSSSEGAGTCVVLAGDAGTPGASESVDEALEFLVTPALERCGLTGVRAGPADTGYASGEHVLCIAILTGADPTVYYRLARVQAAGRPVIALLRQDDPALLGTSEVQALRYRLTPSATKNQNEVQRLARSIDDVRLAATARPDPAKAASSTAAESTFGIFRHETEERPFIRDAQQELWLVQETGSLMAEKAKAELKGFLRSGGRVCATVTAPTSGIARTMALRNANLAHGAILGRAAQAAAHLHDLVNDVGADAERLCVRYVPYPVGCTLTLADPTHPEKRKRRGLVRFAGFKTPFVDKLDLATSGDLQPVAFENFAAEARRLFLHGSKLVFVTGRPRTGKTTLFTELADSAAASGRLFTLLSPEVADEGERLGFEYRVSGLPQPVRFANRLPSGKYEVPKDALAPAMAAIARAQADGQVLLLDEIGPLQLEQPGFRECIDALVADPRVSVIASLADPLTCELPATRRYVEALMRHPRSTVMRLKQDQNGIRQPIEPAFREQLVQELSAALLLMDQMPRSLWGEPA